MLSLLSLAVALAATPAELPPLHGDPHLAPTTASPWLGVQGAAAVSGPTLRVQTGWARHGLVYTSDGEQTAVIAQAWGLHLAAGVDRGRVHVGATASVWPYVDGEPERAEHTVLGDPTAHVLVRVLETGALTAAARAQLSLPLGASEHQLGHGGLAAELGVVLDTQAGAWRVGGQLDLQLVPRVTLDEQAVDDALRLAVGGARPLGDRATLGLEAWATQTVRWWEDAPPGLELLGTVGLPWQARTLRVGGGVGLLSGVGVPTWRLVLDLSRPAPVAR